MAVDWTALLDAAKGGDESARAGAIIHAQAKLEQHLTASGWPHEDGESLLQRLLRVRKQTNAPWISDDIAWAIQLRNRIAHEGILINHLDALRAVQAYQDAALKLGWNVTPDPSAAPPTPDADAEEDEKPPKRSRRRAARAEEDETAEDTAPEAPRKRRAASRKKPERTEVLARAEGGFLAALVLFGVLLVGVWGLARWRQGSQAPMGLRSWELPVGASASSAAEGFAALQGADGDPRTAWCEGREGVGIGERLTLHLAAPTWVEGVRLKGGDQRDAIHLDQSRAPAQLTLIAGPHAVGRQLSPALGVFEELALPEAVQVSSLTLVVEDVTGGSSAETCISEVEVRVRR